MTSSGLRRPSSLRSSRYCESTNQTIENPIQKKIHSFLIHKITSYRISDPFLILSRFGSELQNFILSNDRKMQDLKHLTRQLDTTCNVPCKDTVEIQPITGTGDITCGRWVHPTTSVLVPLFSYNLINIWPQIR